MKALFAALFAVMIGLSFVGSTYAADAPAPAAGEMKKDEGKKAEKKEKKEKKAKKEKKEEKK
jgi:ribosomal protein L12E/L44/L45/RPP1/RPP2